MEYLMHLKASGGNMLLSETRKDNQCTHLMSHADSVAIESYQYILQSK